MGDDLVALTSWNAAPSPRGHQSRQELEGTDLDGNRPNFVVLIKSMSVYCRRSRKRKKDLTAGARAK